MNLLTWQDALDKLKSGNQHFVNDKLDGKLQNSSRRKELISEQNPYAVIIGCSDSRVVPEILFDTGLGELFVIRVAGSIANLSTIASVEYAIVHLNVKLIIVLAHENCGAIAAAMNMKEDESNFKYLYNHIKPALDIVKEKTINKVAKQNAELTKSNLRTNSSIISNYITHKKIKIVTAFYNLDSGKVNYL